MSKLWTNSVGWLKLCYIKQSLLGGFQGWNCFYVIVRINWDHLTILGDHREITFVMLNRFCLLSNHPTPPTPILNGQYQDGQNTNQNQIKIHALFTW